MKYRVTASNEYGSKTVKLYFTEQLDQVGSMAFELVQHWGMIAAKIEGEDSTGRSKLELQSPEEMVNRAFLTAQLFWDRARAFNHVVQLPDLNEINAEYDAKQKEKEAENA